MSADESENVGYCGRDERRAEIEAGLQFVLEHDAELLKRLGDG